MSFVTPVFQKGKAGLFMGLLVSLMLPVSHASENFTVTFKGCVQQKEAYVFDQPQRLYGLLQFAGVQSCAYTHGVSWLLESKKPEQQKLKAELLKDLSLLESAAETDELKLHLSLLKRQLEAMPVTGRYVPFDADAFRVAVRPLKNRLVVSDSTFLFPKMPQRLQLWGFEQTDMPFFSASSLTDYWHKNGLKPFYEKGRVYVVHANGTVEHRRVGYWAYEANYPSPGSWIVAPLKPAVFNAADGQVESETFHKNLTQWLATQVIYP